MMFKTFARKTEAAAIQDNGLTRLAYNASGVATLLGVGTGTVYWQARYGTIPAHYVGARVVFPAKLLHRVLCDDGTCGPNAVVRIRPTRSAPSTRALREAQSDPERLGKER